jgi:hypothetical protein
VGRFPGNALLEPVNWWRQLAVRRPQLHMSPYEPAVLGIWLISKLISFFARTTSHFSRMEIITFFRNTQFPNSFVATKFWNNYNQRHIFNCRGYIASNEMDKWMTVSW